MSDTENEVFPASKLGEYTVLRDVAEGTFGKVKSMYLEFSIVPHLILLSGPTHRDRPHRCHEIHIKSCHSQGEE